MDISVIGTGYVGLVTGVCLAELGNRVTCIDTSHEKIEKLKAGISPIYEEGLTELIQKNIENDNVHFTTDYKEGLSEKKVIYIAVGTPQDEDGSADLTYINEVCLAIAENLKQDAVIVTKSTVPVGTNEYIKNKIESNLTDDITIKIASNPEFLRQGSAVYDTFHGDRVVIGSDDAEALKLLTEINGKLSVPIVKTDLRSAEMIKYASNAFLATKISFINEVANLSEKIGANIDHVAEGMGMDHRIGKHFLNSGIGYGGSCFPKDTKALASIGKKVDYNMPLLNNVIHTNELQKKVIVEKVEEQFGDVEGKNIAILGLAFKPNTDDMREAPSILITKKLIEKGANVYAYDPIAMTNAKRILSKEIKYCSSIEEAIENVDITIILTEWQEIKDFPLENYKKHMKHPVLFDGRNCFTLEQARENDIEYHSIGRPVVHPN